MSKRIELESQIEQLLKQSAIEQMIQEVDATHIPVHYIQSIVFYFEDGSEFEMSQEELKYTLPLNKNGCWDRMRDHYQGIREVKVLLDTALIEKDITHRTKILLDRICN